MSLSHFTRSHMHTGTSVDLCNEAKLRNTSYFGCPIGSTEIKIIHVLKTLYFAQVSLTCVWSSAIEFNLRHVYNNFL